MSALILANGKSPTTFVPTHRLLLQRIIWDPTADVVANALRLLGSIRWQHETTWVSQGPSYPTMELDGMAGASGLVSDGLAGLDP